MNPGDNICAAGPFGNQRYHFRFGKDRTQTADGRRALGFERQGPETVQIHFERAGHDLQKTSGTGRAFVVHGKIPHPAGLVQGDGLAVLPPDIDDGPDGRVLEMGPAGMTGDFGHGLVGEGHAVAAIAGGHDPVRGIGGQVKFGQQVRKNLFTGGFRIVAGQHHFGSNQLAIPYQRRLGADGADIYSDGKHRGVLSLLRSDKCACRHALFTGSSGLYKKMAITPARYMISPNSPEVTNMEL